MKFAEVAGNVKRLLKDLPSQETFIHERSKRGRMLYIESADLGGIE